MGRSCSRDGTTRPRNNSVFREQQEIEREEHRMQREDAQAQTARDVAQAQAQRENELEVLRLRGNIQQDQQNKRTNTKTPKLP